MAQEAFQVSTPLPGRNAYLALQQQIIDYLSRVNPAPGEPFLSDHELTRASGLARNTVRRALDLLAKDGWIERRHGKGTFVGTRIARPDSSTQSSSTRTNARSTERNIRLAVLMGYPAGPRHGWYSLSVLRGLEDAAIDERISIELFNFGANDDHIRRRLDQSRPDVLACLSPPPRWAMLIAETRSRGIPVLLTGVHLAEIGLPVMYEDSKGGTELAVQHLLEQGHRKISFLQDLTPASWAFDRLESFIRTMRQAGLDPDNNNGVLWVDREGLFDDRERITRYLTTQKPTALVLGSGGVMEPLGPVLNELKISVPDDLSIVSFDQAAATSPYLPNKKITIVALPLFEMGQLLAKQARQAAEGTLEPGVISVLPCKLQLGESVRSV